jgi:hypothetical protein
MSVVGRRVVIQGIVERHCCLSLRERTRLFRRLGEWTYLSARFLPATRINALSRSERGRWEPHTKRLIVVFRSAKEHGFSRQDVGSVDVSICPQPALTPFRGAKGDAGNRTHGGLLLSFAPRKNTSFPEVGRVELSFGLPRINALSRSERRQWELHTNAWRPIVVFRSAKEHVFSGGWASGAIFRPTPHQRPFAERKATMVTRTPSLWRPSRRRASFVARGRRRGQPGLCLLPAGASRRSRFRRAG